MQKETRQMIVAALLVILALCLISMPMAMAADEEQTADTDDSLVTTEKVELSMQAPADRLVLPDPATTRNPTKEVPYYAVTTRDNNRVAEERYLAKAVWGEARGLSRTQQAAVVWCVLNRVDSKYYPNNIRDVVTARGQFVGYRANNPVDKNILYLVQDVLHRWDLERAGYSYVGRVLPYDYYHFRGKNGVNLYYNNARLRSAWDWSWGTPYSL